ncbi:hypothetical protein KFK09_022246 [Dendrobium nobile]|uniref:Uncharacterized protein n=1 Tax=Dendrobium nobile TaxID=94219 RepID=A0A8T3AI30_DENNO|nr:hypothetical protein KFK09_022246 [Dendrobium nobile]
MPPGRRIRPSLSFCRRGARRRRFRTGPAPANSRDSNGGGEPPFGDVVLGEDVSGLLAPTDLTRFLVSQSITHVHLSNPSRSLLAALNSTGVRILITIPNSLLLAFASSPSSASSWASRIILPFITSISAIEVGDDFSASVSTSLLLPALPSLSSAISDLHSDIPISTLVTFSVQRI